MTVHSVVSLPKIPYTHRIYMVLANPVLIPYMAVNETFPWQRRILRKVEKRAESPMREGGRVYNELFYLSYCHIRRIYSIWKSHVRFWPTLYIFYFHIMFREAVKFVFSTFIIFSGRQSTHRWLHGEEGNDLEQVVLDDVSDDAVPEIV